MTLDVQALLERAGLDGLQRIALARIARHPDNPRRDFDPEEISALAVSIRERGLLQPISVYPADEAGVHLIRFGERRYRAAIEAGLSEIDAIIADPPDRLTQLVDQVVENDQRIDLSTRELAEAITALGAAGLSKAEIARQLGRPASTISLYAAVNDMPGHLQSLANDVGIRALHDLYRLWRKAPEPVDAFVDVTPAEAIDRHSVSLLIAAQKEQLSGSRTDRPSGGASVVEPGASEPMYRPTGGVRIAVSSLSHVGRVRIVFRDQQGMLLFPTDLIDGQLLIQIDGEEQARKVSATEVSILHAIA